MARQVTGDDTMTLKPFQTHFCQIVWNVADWTVHVVGGEDIVNGEVHTKDHFAHRAPDRPWSRLDYIRPRSESIFRTSA